MVKLFELKQLPQAATLTVRQRQTAEPIEIRGRRKYFKMAIETSTSHRSSSVPGRSASARSLCSRLFGPMGILAVLSSPHLPRIFILKSPGTRPKQPKDQTRPLKTLFDVSPIGRASHAIDHHLSFLGKRPCHIIIPLCSLPFAR